MDEIQKLQIAHSQEHLPLQGTTDAIPNCEMCSHGNSISRAMWYCEFCCQFLCAECKQSHASDKKHNFKRLIKGKPKSFDMHGLDICDLHNKYLRYLCEDDDSVCCENCIEERHERCENVISISDLSDGSTFTPQFEILRLQNEAKLQMKWADSVIKDLATKIENAPTRFEQERNDLLHWFERQRVTLLGQFDSAIQTVKDEANAIKDKSEAVIAINSKHCDNVIKKMELVKCTLTNIAKCGSNTQKVIAKFRLQEFQQTVKTLTDINIVTFNFEQMQRPELRSRQRETLSVQVQTPDSTPVKLFLEASLELKQSGDEASQPFYTGMTFLLDGRLVAVDNKNMKCLVFNEALKRVGSNQLLYNPQNITAVSEELVAITNFNMYTIDFLRVSKCNEIAPVRSLQVTRMYGSICMKDDDAHCVVRAIDDTRPVRIVSISGEEKDFNIDFPKKKYTLHNGSTTYIMNSDKVVLTDRYEHLVYIYDTNTNTKVTVMDEQIVEPRGVAVGPFDCLFVCCSATDSLV